MESVESVLKKKRKATAGRILSRSELGRFYNYSNFRYRLIHLLFSRPPVACYGEAAIVKTARHVFAWTLY